MSSGLFKDVTYKMCLEIIFDINESKRTVINIL